mmetsp:Transcript_16204/g.37447  ORF Transcript_16204/g.37447 Transcript_16204/m.37447 type:complete len:323 (-) Transcript_16204:327-1295(-)
MDELMSAYKPRTTQAGGFPNISFVARKPEPLGVELKALIDAVTTIMLYLEIQRGKEAMNTPKYGKYSNEVGSTASFVKRCIERTKYSGLRIVERLHAKSRGSTELYLGDSWFSGIKAALVALEEGVEYFGPVKTSTAGFPKAEMEEIMKDAPSGSHIVFECEEHRLFAVAYRYSLRSKVLCFIGTWNAGSTIPGEPYIARFGDEYGNLQSRAIMRPDVISRYFKVSDKIDNHNKSRQSDLGLERLWLTKNCWFRLSTTFLGIVAVDTWHSIRHHAAGLAYTDMPIKKFAKCLVFDLWNKPWDTTRSRPLQLTCDYDVRPTVD